MCDKITLSINGREVSVPRGTSVASAVAWAGEFEFRESPSGQFRGPVCGMGICNECAVTINGRPHHRSCMIHCRDGMEVQTDV